MMARVRLVPSIGALLALGGCAAVLGIDTLVEGDAPLELGEACGGCVAATCAAAERACAADDVCADLARCTGAHVGDPAGRAACVAASPDAAELPTWRALDACLRGGCFDGCTGSSGLVAGLGDACDACMADLCPAETVACLRDAACERVVVAALADPRAFSPPAISELWSAAASAIDGCTNRACGPSCGRSGENYECLGGYDWPNPVSTVTEADVVIETRIIEDAVETVPVEGVTLEACAPIDDACDPLDSAVSGPEGIAVLTVPVPSIEGFLGYFKARGAPGSEIIPARSFVGRPIYGPARGRLTVLDETTFALAFTLAQTEPLVGRGHAIVVFADCALDPSPGVEIVVGDLADDVTVFYPLQGAPPTSAGGEAALLNLPEGCFEVAGRRDGRETHRVRFATRAGELSVAFAAPLDASGQRGYLCSPDSAPP
jgi:hypothetical protein